MKIDKFEEIEAWKEARRLVKDLYSGFSKCRDFSLKDQIQRAGISVMSNIAEGFERNTNKEFINFLSIARGSLAEVKSLLYAAKDIGYIDKNVFDSLFDRANKVNGLLNGFISYLKSNLKRK
ncbi:MAG: four helix bundle protein [Candidatus Aminicenantes bacterium]|nr:four helix bundle protein [Acidobacteriota bacterium]MCG2812700.1 four helix bundle protein [Candidatus Aminicenantes bacterium]